jgi:hypothetical protein
VWSPWALGAIILTSPPAASQILHFDWLAHGGGLAADFASDVAIDAAGNTFVVGAFRDAAQFGSASLLGFSGEVFLVRSDPRAPDPRIDGCGYRERLRRREVVNTRARSPRT